MFIRDLNYFQNEFCLMKNENFQCWKFAVTIDMIVSGKVCKNPGQRGVTNWKVGANFEWSIALNEHLPFMGWRGSPLLSRPITLMGPHSLVFYGFTIPHMGLLEPSVDQSWVTPSSLSHQRWPQQPFFFKISKDIHLIYQLLNAFSYSGFSMHQSD